MGHSGKGLRCDDIVVGESGKDFFYGWHVGRRYPCLASVGSVTTLAILLCYSTFMRASAKRTDRFILYKYIRVSHHKKCG
jgi:hypothetical protein